MADSLLPEDAPPAIASQDELEAVYDYRAAQFDQQAGGGGTGTDLTDFLEPDIDEFVPVDIDPKMIHEVQPSYPRQARATGMEGDLWIAVLVGIDGTVKDVRLRKPSGIEALDLAATEAAWKNRFSPAIRRRADPGLGDLQSLVSNERIVWNCWKDCDRFRVKQVTATRYAF